MRIGLLGAGRIGAFHAGTLAAHPDVAELLVADADPARSERVAAGHGGRALTVDALFAARPDAVVVATATSTHADLLARAARGGIPAFCEKPLARDLPGTLAAVRAAERDGAVLQVGFQRRFDPEYAAAREAVRAGKVGRLHTVRTVSSDAVPPPAAYVPLSGGLYRDCLIHDFDALRWVTGREVAEVYAAGANVGADFFRAASDVDTGAVLLTLEGGVLATATAARYHAAGYDVRMELAGTEGQLAVGTGPRAPLSPAVPPPAAGTASAADAGAGRGGGTAAGGGVRPAVPPPWPGFLDRFAAAYVAELAAFLRVARGEADNPCTPRDALRALLVAEACERSRAGRRPVALAELDEVTGELGAGAARATERATPWA
ncbi:putative oxidoreductase [Actinacidiphila reveromycinica]|uniref:Putative oxidoreductase n=1 Tax=Actinacidiphila reveromycinica TaxID=659352 RepID=A0A7U3UYI2_9ACTN|nr:Gfo/Idh/MocA family oxidoreductase [Streptomyces sp. SN-593]BBB00937.1 putative oxidoreductase [Streptomyces sp. SN-593]